MTIHKRDKPRRPTRSKYFRENLRKVDDQSTKGDGRSEISEGNDGEGSEDTGDNSNQGSRKRSANVLSRTKPKARKKAKSIPEVEQTNTTRGVGSIEYSNDTIHPDTMSFLKGKSLKLEELGASISKE